MRTASGGILGCVAMLALAGCSVINDGDPKPTELETALPMEEHEYALSSLESCDELRDYLTEVMVEEVVKARYQTYYWNDDDGDIAMDSDADGMSDSSSSETSESPSDFTETNTQEQGVDEPDFVKTDGNFIYVVHQNELSIVKSWPVETSEKVGAIDIVGNPRSMFLHEDQIVVFSYVTYYDDPEITELFDNTYYVTRMTFVDVSDRTDPTVTREIDVKGYFNTGRMVDGQVYTVMNSWTYLPNEVWNLTWNNDIGLPPVPAYNAPDRERELARDLARNQLRPMIRQLVDETDLGGILPMMRDQVVGAPTAEIEPLVECHQLYRPKDTTRLGVLSVAHVDLNDTDAPVEASGLLADGWTVYASKDNLYIAQTNWWSWWGWNSEDFKIQSYIHKFVIGEGSRPRYAATGAVDGWLLNQFSMSEHEGFLRVATTEMDWWWWNDDEVEPGNHVTILQEMRGVLQETGSVRGLAPGERIYASRMMGDRGYVVTFRQVDPLFTLDLSDPYDPRLVGELKIPGFSTYMHPMGPDHLLAVGRDGNDEGQVFGMAVSIFDVSDMADPQLIHKYSLGDEGWSWSEALYDHHAFTYHRGVLSIPAYSWNWDETTGEYDFFSGLLVLDANETTGIQELGRIDHVDLVEESACIYDGWGCGQNGYWYNRMRRSVYIEDNVFSISMYGMKVNELHNPENEITRVLFWPEE